VRTTFGPRPDRCAEDLFIAIFHCYLILTY